MSNLQQRTRTTAGPGSREATAAAGDDDDDDDDVDDEGSSTVWFAETSATPRTLSFLSAWAPGGPDTNMLDIGTGNGELLFLLRQHPRWKAGKGRLLGVDYSASAVQLAQARARARGLEGRVDFQTWDVLAGSVDDDVVSCPAVKKAGGWDVVLDKGTFDAVSLSGDQLRPAETSPDGEGRSRRIMSFEAYPSRVARLVRPGGIVLVTSCNWTEAELERWWTVPVDGLGADTAAPQLLVLDRFKYPTFSFGGSKGQRVCTLVFTRRE